jgi:hypothetical protein
MEEAMRRIVLAAATLAILAVGSFVPNRAEAMTAPTPAGLVAALEGTNLAQDVAYVCRRVWRCGPYGYCGWRRACWYTGGGPYYYGYGGPSYYGGPYYYGRPYYRRYWW